MHNVIEWEMLEVIQSVMRCSHIATTVGLARSISDMHGMTGE
jgi:hypothetical protein